MGTNLTESKPNTQLEVYISMEERRKDFEQFRNHFHDQLEQR